MDGNKSNLKIIWNTNHVERIWFHIFVACETFFMPLTYKLMIVLTNRLFNLLKVNLGIVVGADENFFHFHLYAVWLSN